MLKVHREMKTRVLAALLLVALTACGAPALYPSSFASHIFLTG